MWPIFVRKAKFIVALVNSMDRNEPLQRSQERLVGEFVDRLEAGPFLGGRNHPSLADLSAFAIIVFPYRFGLKGDANWLDNQQIRTWIDAVQQHLPDNPFLIDNEHLTNGFSEPIS